MFKGLGPEPKPVPAPVLLRRFVSPSAVPLSTIAPQSDPLSVIELVVSVAIAMVAAVWRALKGSLTRMVEARERLADIGEMRW